MSVSDNFEWASELSTRFGRQNVNYTTLARAPKASLFTFVYSLRSVVHRVIAVVVCEINTTCESTWSGWVREELHNNHNGQIQT